MIDWLEGVLIMLGWGIAATAMAFAIMLLVLLLIECMDRILSKTRSYKVVLRLARIHWDEVKKMLEEEKK